MQTYFEDDQVSMFDPGLQHGKTSPARSPPTKARTSGASWKKRSELVYRAYMFLKVIPGVGNILGQPYWELLAPFVGESLTLNYAKLHIIELMCRTEL